MAELPGDPTGLHAGAKRPEPDGPVIDTTATILAWGGGAANRADPQWRCSRTAAALVGDDVRRGVVAVDGRDGVGHGAVSVPLTHSRASDVGSPESSVRQMLVTAPSRGSFWAARALYD